jgi:hypothetical protein
METGSSHFDAKPAANTEFPKSSVLIPVSVDEIMQTLILPQFRALDQAVISRLHGVDRVSIPVHVMWDFRWIKWKQERFFSEKTGVFFLLLFAPCCTHVFISSTITDAIYLYF